MPEKPNLSRVHLPHPPRCHVGLRAILYNTNTLKYRPTFTFAPHRTPPTSFSKPLSKNFLYPIITLSVTNLRRTMTMNAIPELGVPLEDEVKHIPLPERADALGKTVDELEKHGADLEPDEVDKEVAATLATAYAQDPDKTSKKVTHKRAAALTPASVRLTSSIIDEFNHSVVESSKQLRNLVTNKLIIESENPDPRVRMRALELLGKISDVGLFTEKSEVTITHQTTDDIKEKLRGKLAKLVNPQPEVEDATVIEAQLLDTDEEFGFDDDD